MARMGMWDVPDDVADAAAAYRCAKCGAGMKTSRRTCPRCTRNAWIKAVAGILVLGEGCFALYSVLFPPRKSDFIPYVPPKEPVQARKDGGPGGPGGWFFYKTKDPLLGDVTAHARLISNRPVAPGGKTLEGATTGTLEVSSSSSYGQRVMVTLDSRVKTACRANPCSVHATFDQSAPEPFPFQDWSNESNTILSLGDFPRFTQHLTGAHEMVLIAKLGMQQDYLLTFTVAGYKLALRSVTRLAASAPRAGRPDPG